MIIPLLVIFGVSIVTITLVHLVLSVKGSRFAMEASSLSGVGVFIVIETLLGIFSFEWTLVMLLIVTPFMIIEVFRPTTGLENTQTRVLGVEEEDALCFSSGNGYTALAAVLVEGIPSGDIRSREHDEEDADLKWLVPLWADSNVSGTVYSMEAAFEKGAAKIRFFVSSHDKDWERALEKAHSGRRLLESWLDRNKYDFKILLTDELWNAYSELDYGELVTTEEQSVVRTDHSCLGILSVQGTPTAFSDNINLLLQELLKIELSGKVIVSFNSGQVPRLGRELSESQADPQVQSRIPHRVEEHRLRKMYKQMAEVEVCEDTGAFNVGISVVVEGTSVVDTKDVISRIESAIQSTLSGTTSVTLSNSNIIRTRRKIAFRQFIRRAASISGARLTTLLHLSEVIPGIQTRSITPEFALPTSISSSSPSINVGYALHRGRATTQEYRIPLDSFCLHGAIYGNPGGGKTNTAHLIVDQIQQHGVPFLAIVPSKKEWRVLCENNSDTRIFTARDLRFNFMEVPPGVPVATHIMNVTTCFIATWPSEGIMREHIIKVFRRAYTRNGWNLFTDERGRIPLLTDLYASMEEVASELKYSGKLKQDFIGALTARFESLLEDPVLSIMFNTSRGLSISDLLNYPTILELNNLDDSHKALVTSLIMVGVAEYLEANCSGVNPGLQHLLVLEEAHHVLKQVSSTNGYEGHSVQQHAIDTIIQLLREARGLGLGVLLIDQLPGHLATAAAKLPGIMILHTLFDARERALVGGYASLTEDQLQHVGLMQCGEAVIHQVFTGKAVNVQVTHFHSDPDPTQPPWTDERVETFMKPFYQKCPHLLEVHIPVISKWKPDEGVLAGILFTAEGEGFLDEFNNRMTTSEDYANSLVRMLIREVLAQNTDRPIPPLEVDSYFDIVLKSIREKIDTPDHQSSEDDVSGRESFA